MYMYSKYTQFIRTRESKFFNYKKSLYIDIDSPDYLVRSLLSVGGIPYVRRYISSALQLDRNCPRFGASTWILSTFVLVRRQQFRAFFRSSRIIEAWPRHSSIFFSFSYNLSYPPASYILSLVYYSEKSPALWALGAGNMFRYCIVSSCTYIYSASVLYAL